MQKTMAITPLTLATENITLYLESWFGASSPATIAYQYALNNYPTEERQQATKNLHFYFSTFQHSINAANNTTSRRQLPKYFDQNAVALLAIGPQAYDMSAEDFKVRINDGKKLQPQLSKEATSLFNFAQNTKKTHTRFKENADSLKNDDAILAFATGKPAATLQTAMSWAALTKVGTAETLTADEANNLGLTFKMLKNCQQHLGWEANKVAINQITDTIQRAARRDSTVRNALC